MVAWREAWGAASIAVGERAPDQVLVRGEDVFFTTYVSDGAIRRASLAGGAAEDVVGGQLAPIGLAEKGGVLYWSTSDGGIHALTDQGHAILASGELAPSIVAVDAERVVWTTFLEAGAVRSVPRAGGDPADVAADLGSPAGVALADGYAYFAAFDDGVVARAPLDGGAVEVLAEGEGGPAGVATDGERVCWASMTAGVVACANVDGSARVTVAKEQTAPNGVAMEGGWVYFTNHAAGASVARARVPGSGP